MPTTADPKLVDAWRELMQRHAAVNCALDKALGEAHGLTVSEYEVLERMAEQDEWRMQELADSVHLTQSALSRLIGRLEAEALVCRKMCTTDRRGIFACITPEGRARQRAAEPTHRAVLERTLAV